MEERDEVRKREERDEVRKGEEREEIRKGEEEDRRGSSPVETALRLQTQQAARMRPLLTPSSSAELSSTLTGKRTEPINTRP